MTYQFQTLEQGKPSPVRQIFMEAWNDMYIHVKGLMDSGNISLQMLETSMWIESKFDNGNTPTPIFFYDARDYAIQEHGWTQPK
jgi:hypothetical protein